MNQNAKVYEGDFNAAGGKFAIVASRFNAFIVEKLVEGALDALRRHGADVATVDVAWVPGTFEMPLVARRMATSKKYDAVICLGAVIRGGTPHFDYVAGQCARGVFQAAWDSARQEAGAAFGNDGMYMEKLIVEPRHIEIQIIGDSTGKACHLSERDCSVQRRHQKLTEEAPSPFMTKELRKRMGKAAVKAAEAVKYEGAGTVEFLVDKDRNFYFMEMNTRIQVEHPVTEEVINYDLIAEQIKVASGTPISGKNYEPTLHAIECRINAEDPMNDFRPCPGKITNYHAPGGHGVRVDTHVYAGYVIPPYYDSMIAKLIVVAQTRDAAIEKMKRALREFTIEGVKTTIPFHLQLMDHEDYRSGNYTTKFMEDFIIKG